MEQDDVIPSRRLEIVCPRCGHSLKKYYALNADGREEWQCTACGETTVRPGDNPPMIASNAPRRWLQY